MFSLDNPIFFVFCVSTTTLQPTNTLVQFLILLFPVSNPFQYLFMSSQLRGEFGFLHVTIVTVTAKRQIHLCTVTSSTLGNSMLYVVFGVCSQEVCYSDFLTCVKALVILLFPQLILQYISISRIGYIFFYLLSAFFSFLLVISLPGLDSPSTISVVQVAGELDINLGLWCNLPFFQ